MSLYMLYSTVHIFKSVHPAAPTLNASNGGHNKTISLVISLHDQPACQIIQPLFSPDLAFHSVKGMANFDSQVNTTGQLFNTLLPPYDLFSLKRNVSKHVERK